MRITTNRGEFNVRTYGEPTSQPLIALHGWPQTSYCWHHASSFLKDIYLIAPDLRGMGDSNRSLDLSDYHKDQMAQDILSIADSLNLNKFCLAGHDWGGAIAQELAFLAPERISKMIIINMIILNNPIGQKKANALLLKSHYRSAWYQHFMSIKEFPEVMIEGKEEPWVRFFSRGIANPIPEDAIGEYIRCYKIKNTITTASNIYRTLSKDRKRWQSFNGVKVNIPTKVIHGTLDPVIIKEYLEGAEQFFSSLSIHRLPGGHFIVDELPKEVGEAMSVFLNT